MFLIQGDRPCEAENQRIVYMHGAWRTKIKYCDIYILFRSLFNLIILLRFYAMDAADLR
jgi:hypothetical protein